MKRRIIKFQNGGFIPQVYNTQQVNPVFLDGNMNQLIQTASMPMESGLQGYMGLQQLDIQRGQEERAGKGEYTSYSNLFTICTNWVYA